MGEAARLIPVSGIHGAYDQEQRATSALLAVLESVNEFGRSITTRLGAPAGHIAATTEVSFRQDGHTHRPDGQICITRGKRKWVALVEVKTGNNKLTKRQVETYLEIARAQHFQAVLTISCEVASSPSEHPTQISWPESKTISLQHLSWSQIRTIAMLEQKNSTVSDPDQAWILSELIRYFDHPKSGVNDFNDMGPSWVRVREAVKVGRLTEGSQHGANVVARWQELVSFAGMELGRRVGVEVLPVLTRGEVRHPSLRAELGVASLAESGTLNGSIRVPSAVAPIELAAHIASGRNACSIDVQAPKQGRPLTRVNWLLRQLHGAPCQLVVESHALWARGPGPSTTLGRLRDNSHLLIDDRNPDIRSFRLTLDRAGGIRRGSGKGSFVDSVVGLLGDFYGDVVFHIRPWPPHPPVLETVYDKPAA